MEMETLWGTATMDEQSIRELITSAQKILAELEQRYSDALNCCSEHEIPNNYAGEPRKRRDFVSEDGIRPDNHRRLWTEKEIEIAQILFAHGWSYDQIASEMKRSRRAVEKIIVRSK